MDLQTRAQLLHNKLNLRWPQGTIEDLMLLTIGLSGEVGELANLIKKFARDGQFSHKEIREEIGDIRCYLELVAMWLNVRTEVEAQLKLDIFEERMSKGEVGVKK